MGSPDLFKQFGTNCKNPSRIVIFFFKTGVDRTVFFMVLAFSAVLCYDGNRIFFKNEGDFSMRIAIVDDIASEREILKGRVAVQAAFPLMPRFPVMPPARISS